MYRQGLRLGLIRWARAPFAAAFGLAIVAGVTVAAWAVLIEVSPSARATWTVVALVANLALAGWGRFCSGARQGLQFVLSGFRGPVSVTLAGAAMLAVIGGPAWAVHAALTFALAPAWLIILATVVAGCATAPPVMTLSIDAAAGTPLMVAATDGLRRSRRAWGASAALCLTACGLAVAGALPGLLLEQHGLAAIGALLPKSIAEFDLTLARMVAGLGAFASVPAASCVWVAVASAGNQEKDEAA